MRNNFAKALALGLAAVAVIVVGAVLFLQRGAQVALPGEIKVRTIATGDADALTLVDLHVTNPSDYPFVVHNASVTLETKDGVASRNLVSRSDSQSLFAAKPETGPYHPPLYTDVSIPARTTTDYTAVAQFSLPERMLKERTHFVLRVERRDGKSFEFVEK